MIWKKVYLLTLAIVLLTLGIAPSLAAAPAYQALPLVNPSFEEPYTNGAANAWYRWHQDSGDKCVNKPADWNFSCQPGWGQEYDYNNYGL